MQYRQLGNTDIQVSTVAMGCWAISGDSIWGEQQKDLVTPTIHAAIDAGINFFDTAPGYVGSEELLGAALGERRRDVIVADKIGSGSMHEADLIRACEESLQKLGTDYIDLMQIHWPDHNTPFTETFGAMQKLKDQGKIRAIGVCNFGPSDTAEVLSHCRFDVNQIAYSLLMRAIEFDIIPACERENISILPYSPLAQGLLTGKFPSADDVPPGRQRTRHFDANKHESVRHGESGCEAETFAAIDAVRDICARIGEPMGHVALAWCLHQPTVASVLAGARSPEQIHANARAADLQLDDATIAELNAATAPVKTALGHNPDPWQGAGSSRIR